jgi:hypothetical protein
VLGEGRPASRTNAQQTNAQCRRIARSLRTWKSAQPSSPILNLRAGGHLASLPVLLEHMFARNCADRLCSFPECNRAHYAKGLCSGHYQQRRFKRSLQPLRIRRPARSQCDFTGCDKTAVNRRLCQGHAMQRKTGQSLRPLRPQYSTKGPCRFEGCPKPRSAGGYCARHAKQYYAGRSIKPLLRPKRDCDFPGCRNRHYALGYCQGHRLQLLEQRPLAPLRQKRGWRLDRGYVMIFEPTYPNARKDGYVALRHEAWGGALLRVT